MSKPDIVINCEHHGYVGRCRWLRSEQRWAAVDSKGIKVTNLIGNQAVTVKDAPNRPLRNVVDYMQGSRADAQIRCHTCNSKLPVRDERLQVTLNRLAAGGLKTPITLGQLRRAYNNTPD
jgi:hypothetical protein